MFLTFVLKFKNGYFEMYKKNKCIKKRIVSLGKKNYK